MSAINPDLHELQQQVADLRVRLANAEGRVDEVRSTATGTVRQTIWQFVIFTVTMAVVLLGGLNYQTEALRREFDARFEAVSYRLDSLNKRFDDRFDDMNKRFDDLKQIVLSNGKPNCILHRSKHSAKEGSHGDRRHTFGTLGYCARL